MTLGVLDTAGLKNSKALSDTKLLGGPHCVGLFDLQWRLFCLQH